jgi:hypothetical protein
MHRFSEYREAMMKRIPSQHDSGWKVGATVLPALVLWGLAFAQTPAPTPGAVLLKEYAGSYDTDAFLRDPRIRPQMEQLLGGELEHLEWNLNVKGSVDLIGGWLSISGNAPHQGTEEEAIVCVSTYNLEVSAAILSKGTVTAYARGGTYDAVPLCVKDWITQVNSQHKDRFDQPQNVRMAGGRIGEARGASSVPPSLLFSPPKS